MTAQGPTAASEKGGAGILQNLRDMLGLPEGEGLRFWEILSISGFAFGLICILIFSFAASNVALVFGVLALLGSAAWLSGGVLGFLFGVPRLRATSTQSAPNSTSAFVPNTNLEQISDWLTKIIVGATLVQLRPLAETLNSAALAIGSELGISGGAPASGAVMVLYFAGGFMWGYLWCSLRVFREMSALITREQAVSDREALAGRPLVSSMPSTDAGAGGGLATPSRD